MISDPNELRKKVILARIAVAAAVVLALVVCLLFNWFGSVSGTLARIEFSLKNDKSQKNILDSLENAEKFWRNGDQDAAKKVVSWVEAALNTAAMNKAAAAKTYLEIAEQLKKRGDKQLASEFAFKAIASVSDYLDKNKDRSSDSYLEILAITDAAAFTFAEGVSNLSTSQMKTVINVAAEESAGIVLRARKTGKEHLIDFVLRSLARPDLATLVSPELVSVRFARDLLLAYNGKLKELDAALTSSVETCSSVYASDPDRLQRILLDHYIDIADSIRDNPLAKGRYLGFAEDCSRKIDRSKIADIEKTALSNSMLKLSRAYISNGDTERGLSYARQAVSLRATDDPKRGESVNQLLTALAAAGRISEAQQVGSEAYKYYKSLGMREPSLLSLRAEFIASYFPVLISARKVSNALSIVNDEIKMQKKFLPEAAQNIVNLNCKLADYYLSKSMLRPAAECAKQINEIVGSKTSRERIDLDMLVLSYASRARVQDLQLKAGVDALATINKSQYRSIDPAWLEGFCTVLEALKKAADEDNFKQAVDLLRTGFLQQLESDRPDPVLLAKIVNTLGVCAQEKLADDLRGQGKERLAKDLASVFLAQSMDFVVSGEQDSSQYTDPKNAIKVYLDLAHSMQNKDDALAFKNAFEALKIIHVIAAKNPELREGLLDDVEESATIMASCRKQSCNNEQLNILNELALQLADYIEKSGKGKILDISIGQTGRQQLQASDELLKLMLIRDEILAKRGQLAQLDRQVKESKNLLEEMHPGGLDPESNMSFARHNASLAEILITRNQAAAARRYLAIAKRCLEDCESEKLDKNSGQEENTDPNSKSSKEKQTLQGAKPQLDRVKLTELWNRISAAFARSGDNQQALACARKSVGMRSLQDIQSARNLLNFTDRLLDSGNLAEAQNAAQQLYDFSKGKTSPDFVSLHASIARKLMRSAREQGNEAFCAALANDELNYLNSLQPSQATYALDTYFDLANYFARRQDSNSTAECIAHIQKARENSRPQDKAAWEQSGKQMDLIVLALRINNATLASQGVSELISSKIADKPGSITTPVKWWTGALVCFKKARDQKAYDQVLDLVKANFKQKLSGSEKNPKELGEMLSELAATGEAESAQELRDAASESLPEASRDEFLANCKGLPAEAAKPKAAPAKTQNNKSVKATPIETRGRLDLSD